MNCPDVNTAAVTINWVTDIIVPLVSALIGGLLALLGVYITLKRDKIERQLEKEENARPFFTPLDLWDSSIIASNNHIFCFSLTNCFDESSSSISANIKNSEKTEFIINKITICGKDYRPFRPEMISKGMLFMIKLYYEDNPYKNDVFMHITDINHNNRIYKLVCEGGFICDFIEIQKDV